MTQENTKVGILFELGEGRRDGTDWPDYTQYGFNAQDVEDLLALVTDSSLNTAPGDSNEVWAPLHAWRALGQLGDPRAIEPIIGMFDTLCEDDWALDELPVVLAMLGPEAIGPLTDFLNNRTHAEFARGMAVSALDEIAQHDPASRDSVVRIITDYLEYPDPDTSSLNGWAVSSLITLEARESIETLRRLYQGGNVDLFACGDIEDVEIELGLREQRTTPPPDFRQALGLPVQQEAKPKKVGRNDPCPCGSGKKYKKCCLQ
jgi:hypothetical protein